MQIVPQSHEIMYITGGGGLETLKCLERAARTCYKSEDRITADSALAMVKDLRNRKHGAMLEFADLWVKCVTDRGVSHELVRHRIASYAQESTRYCNYGKLGEIRVILPPELDDRTAEDLGDLYHQWWHAIAAAETSYLTLLKLDVSPQIARSVLPTCLKTEINIKANLREWRHIFTERTSKAAHPQMRRLMTGILREARQRIPIIFDDLISADEVAA